MHGLKKTLSYVACVAVTAAVCFYVAISMYAPKHEFGGVNEASEYCESYSAVLYITPLYPEEKVSVYPCIATVSKSGDEYCVEQVYVAKEGWLNCYSYITGQIKAGKKYEIEIDTDKHKLMLGNIATEADYEVVDASLKTQGKYCASRNSTKYHYSVDGLPDCTYARKIAEEDMQFFSSTKEAEFFGHYSFCDECEKKPRYDEDYRR